MAELTQVDMCIAGWANRLVAAGEYFLSDLNLTIRLGRYIGRYTRPGRPAGNTQVDEYRMYDVMQTVGLGDRYITSYFKRCVMCGLINCRVLFVPSVRVGGTRWYCVHTDGNRTVAIVR